MRQGCWAHDAHGRFMMIKKMALMIATGTFLVAATSAHRVFIPLKSSADYKSIAVLHKNSARADMNIEPYSLALVKIAHTPKLSLAFLDARGRGGRFVFQQVLVRPRGGAWRSIWADATNGSNDCAAGIAHYDRIIRYVRHQGVSAQKLLPGFQTRLNKARKGDCDFGDFESDDAILGVGLHG